MTEPQTSISQPSQIVCPKSWTPPIVGCSALASLMAASLSSQPPITSSATDATRNAIDTAR